MRRCLQFFIFLVIFSFILGCQQESQKVETSPTEEILPVPEAQEKVIPETPELPSCEYNNECGQGLLCVEGACQTLASLYKTDCENKCTITGVKVETSDGEEYDLSLGQGSYSYAGALEWKLLKTPDYCQGEDPLVAVNIIKKTTGKVVGEQVITLHKGETSDVVTHPTIKKVSFTATLADVSESCS